MGRISNKKKEELRNKKKLIIGSSVVILLIMLFSIYKGFCIYRYYIDEYCDMKYYDDLDIDIKSVDGNIKYHNISFKTDDNFILADTMNDLEYPVDMYGIDGSLDKAYFTIAIRDRLSMLEDYFEDEYIKYKDLLNKYDIESEIDVIEYYLENREEKPGIFTSLSTLKMNYFARGYFSVVCVGDTLYMFDGDLDGYMYADDNFYHVVLEEDNDIYLLTFTNRDEEYFNLNNVLDIIRTINFE